MLPNSSLKCVFDTPNTILLPCQDHSRNIFRYIYIKKNINSFIYETFSLCDCLFLEAVKHFHSLPILLEYCIMYLWLPSFRRVCLCVCVWVYFLSRASEEKEMKNMFLCLSQSWECLFYGFFPKVFIYFFSFCLRKLKLKVYRSPLTKIFVYICIWEAFIFLESFRSNINDEKESIKMHIETAKCNKYL
jgi:hypothetical protein